MPLDTRTGVASLLLLLCSFYGLGLGVFRLLGVRTGPVDGIYAVSAGWGAAVTTSILGAYIAVPLRFSLYAGLIAGTCILALGIWRSCDRAQYGLVAVALLSVLPAIFAATSFSSLQYDEFSQWLPNAFYLYSNDALPTAAFPNQFTSKQGYPIGIPYVTYAISIIEKAWDDRTAKVLPLVLAALFGTLLAGIWLRTDRPSASATAVAVLVVTLLNPFLDPRIAVTTYSDVPTAFLVAAMVYALCRATDNSEDSRGWIIRASCTALTLVQLRETNIGLVLTSAFAVPLATALANSDDARAPKPLRSVIIAVAFVMLPLAGFLVWRLHLNVQRVGPDMMPRALSEWNWSAPKMALASLVSERLANNPMAGATAIVVGVGSAIAAIFVWRRNGERTKYLIVHVALLTVAQIALLVFAYVAVFDEEEVTRAASAWRYASHLGPLFMVTCTQIVPRWEFRWTAVPPRYSLYLIVGVVLAVQIQFTGRWRIDCVYPHVRPGYDALVSLFADIPPNASVTVVNTADTRLFGDAARLARVVATNNWHARLTNTVDTEDALPTSDYVIDLRGADPELFRNGQTILRTPMHRTGQNAPIIKAVTTVATCRPRKD